MSLEAWGDEGNDTYGPDEIEEILAEVHEELEAGASSARIHEIAAKHPSLQDIILAFVGQWAVSPGSDLTDDMPLTDGTRK